MGIEWYAFALLFQTAYFVSGNFGCDDVVPFTPVANATKRLAVCLDGSSAGYHHAHGSGNGAKSWLLYLKGGGWCHNYNDCQSKRTGRLGSTRNVTTQNFTGILSQHQHVNPDFYNWNRVYIYYCDQSSFLGDTEILDEGQNLQFRGSRIFNAVIEDLLTKGMNNAENAILTGQSAGGLATILHCDGFRARLSDVGKVKCLSDAGFFLRAKDLPHAHYREMLYASIISLHNISSYLPKSCTRKIDPHLRLFPEYLVGNVKTPLFILNSAFDYYQLAFNLVPIESPENSRWRKCLGHLQQCAVADSDLLKDFGTTFVNTIRGIPQNPSRGTYIHSCLTHAVTIPDNHHDVWNPNSTFRLENLAVVEAVGNWFFDRSPVNVIEDDSFPNGIC